MKTNKDDTVMADDVREELYEIFNRMQDDYDRIRTLLSQNASASDYNAAKSYWLANIEVGIRAHEYHTYNPTFEQFLEDNGIIDEDGEFLHPEPLSTCCGCGHTWRAENCEENCPACGETYENVDFDANR